MQGFSMPRRARELPLLGAILVLAACSQGTQEEPAVDEGAAPQTDENRQLAANAFRSLDKAGRGYVDSADMEAYRATVFASIDSDDSGSLERPEFLLWDYGFQAQADEAGKRGEYDDALSEVFDGWDTDGDGSISPTEHEEALQAQFDSADANADGQLTKDEFLNGFSVMKAIRAVLEGQ